MEHCKEELDSILTHFIPNSRYHEHQSDQFSWYSGAKKDLICKNFKQISKLNVHFFSDVLVDIIRQLTDITDKDREIVKKLENASYRRFAFEQVKNLQCILHHKLVIVLISKSTFLCISIQGFYFCCDLLS